MLFLFGPLVTEVALPIRYIIITAYCQILTNCHPTNYRDFLSMDLIFVVEMIKLQLFMEYLPSRTQILSLLFY